MNRRARAALAAAVLAAACRPGAPRTPESGDPAEAAIPGFEPPVVINAETPVRYPPALYAAKTEGTVVLRLFVDETGTIVADSTRIAEGSGFQLLDAAATAAVPAMRFAPARRNGTPVATGFLQPVHFRHPEGADPRGEL